MNWTPRFRSWFRNMTRRSAVERDMDAEIRFHIESYAADLVRTGMAPDEALRRARLEFGTVEAKKEDCRASLGLLLWDELRGDLRYALRMLRKSPGVTFIAVITLALGIGANTAIFSVVDAVLLRPLPYDAPEKLVQLGRRTSDGLTNAISVPNFVDWRREGASVFENASAYDILLSGFDLSTPDGPTERLTALHVSANFFQTLGIQPQFGRFFAADEDHAGRDAVVILSHRLWRERFGSDRNMLGRSLVLSGRAYTVIGILPPRFTFSRNAELWTPLVPEATSQDRKANIIGAIARLRPGISLTKARAEFAVISRRLQQEYPDDNKDVSAGLVPLQQQLVGDVRRPLLVLLGAVGLVLLVACANVANLLLAQAAGRQREISLRAALGARRGRIARQLLTESVLLSLAGAGAGLLLAHWASAGLLAVSPADMLLMNEVAIDWRVLLFAVLLALATGLVFGAAPALQVFRIDLNEVLKEGGRGTSAPRRRLRNVLVASEVALALVLSVGAALLIDSFVRLLRVQPGFDAERVLTLQLPLSDARFKTAADVANLYRKFLPGVGGIPGVQRAAVSTSLPLEPTPDFPVSIEGRAMPNEELPDLTYIAVSPDYFATLQIPVVRGRVFRESDNENSSLVVLINESAARRWWPEGNAIGQHIWIARNMGPQFADKAPREIVGIVGDVRNYSLRERPTPSLYVPLPQVHDGLMSLFARLLPLTVVVRTSGEPLALTASVQQKIWATDAQQPITNVRALRQVTRQSLTTERFLAWLLGAFGGLALSLAAIGIYGVISYSVTQRTNEIGVRMALGASRGKILRMVLGDGLRITVVGIAAGVALTLALARSVQTMLYGVRPWDAAIYCAIAALLAVIAAAASLLPARRAMRVDPMVALRYE